MTYSGERFFHFDSAPMIQSEKLFFSRLDFFCGAVDWFCNGTFFMDPSVFVQTYIIHASAEGILIPFVSVSRKEGKVQ